MVIAEEVIGWWPELQLFGSPAFGRSFPPYNSTCNSTCICYMQPVWWCIFKCYDFDEARGKNWWQHFSWGRQCLVDQLSRLFSYFTVHNTLCTKLCTVILFPVSNSIQFSWLFRYFTIHCTHKVVHCNNVFCSLINSFGYFAIVLTVHCWIMWNVVVCAMLCSL